MTLQEVITKHGITVDATFVPFSQSRNKGKVKLQERTLNWRITLRKDGRDVVTTDWSAGIAHCPSYEYRITTDIARCIKHECEHGVRARVGAFGVQGVRSEPILPDTVDVVYGLVMDAGVLNNVSFEDWASEYGYDTDSRSAESIYRACLDIGLKMHAGLGEDVLAELWEASTDY